MPLFSATTTYTPEMYRKMLEFDLNRKYKISSIILYFLSGILLLLCLWSLWLEGVSSRFVFAFFMCIFSALYPFLMKKLVVSSTMKIAMHSDSIFFSQAFTCEFFEDNLEQKSVQSALILYYPQIFKAYETPDSFYLYQSKQKVIILPKASFTVGNPQAFALFLQYKLGERFKGTYQ